MLSCIVIQASMGETHILVQMKRLADAIAQVHTYMYIHVPASRFTVSLFMQSPPSTDHETLLMLFRLSPVVGDE